MIDIGGQGIDSRVLLAPMAGVCDMPFRKVCRRYGAGLTTSEMLTSDTTLWKSRKSGSRLKIEAQSHPVSIQIAGSEPEQMANAAKACVDLGAEIIDINMGCPAKKVCKKLAGSALLSDEGKVEEILAEVVNAVDIPVTLKTRTGPNPEQINAIRIARIAENCGIQAIALHGRTRACKFSGEAEFDTIKAVVDSTDLPVFANGDIDTPEKAKMVLDFTGASAVLVGRGALGRPWIIEQMRAYCEHEREISEPEMSEKCRIIATHIADIHRFYGEHLGVRIARKHLVWYANHLPDGKPLKTRFNTLQDSSSQLQCIHNYFQSQELLH